jgi:hypothetical protein
MRPERTSPGHPIRGGSGIGEGPAAADVQTLELAASLVRGVLDRLRSTPRYRTHVRTIKGCTLQVGSYPFRQRGSLPAALGICWRRFPLLKRRHRARDNIPRAGGPRGCCVQRLMARNPVDM